MIKQATFAQHMVFLMVQIHIIMVQYVTQTLAQMHAAPAVQLHSEVRHWITAYVHVPRSVCLMS